MTDIKNIKVLIFDCYNYSLDELQKMTDFERYDLASTAKSTGSDDTDILGLSEFQVLYNGDNINTIDTYIFFYLEA